MRLKRRMGSPCQDAREAVPTMFFLVPLNLILVYNLFLFLLNCCCQPFLVLFFPFNQLSTPFLYDHYQSTSPGARQVHSQDNDRYSCMLVFSLFAPLVCHGYITIPLIVVPIDLIEPPKNVSCLHSAIVLLRRHSPSAFISVSVLHIVLGVNVPVRNSMSFLSRSVLTPWLHPLLRAIFL